MKNAPNLKYQPADLYTEVVIFAGADAYAHQQEWTEQAGRLAGDNVPPVWLGMRQLEELTELNIVDRGRQCVRVYRAGAIGEQQLHSLAVKLALAGVQEARLFAGIYEREPEENWTPRLAGLKTDAERDKREVTQPLAAYLPEGADLARMAASERGRVLAASYGSVAINLQNNTVYEYLAGIWVKRLDGELKRRMGAIFDSSETPYNPRGIDTAIDAMKLQIPPLVPVRRALIGFENGVYDLSARQFLAHSPENGLLNHNGIVFTGSLPEENLCDHAPYFHRWLMHVAGGDMHQAKRVLAALFMVLANRHDWQLFIEITGEGGSGKTVFTAIASQLAGQSNTASGNMRALDEARGRAQFVGKSLILLPDQPKYTGPGTGIKAITGGDAVEIDGKYEKQFSTVIRAVIIATNNEPMIFTERNGGIARRRVIFRFDYPVSDADKDPELVDKIAREIPVVIRRLLVVYHDPETARLLLCEQRDSAEAMTIKQYTDPLYGFCEHVASLTEPVGMLMGNLNITPRAPRIYLYHAYLAYMEAHGFDRPLTLTRFGADLPKVMKEYGVEYKKARTNAGIRYNIVLASSAEEWLPATPRILDRNNSTLL